MTPGTMIGTRSRPISALLTAIAGSPGIALALVMLLSAGCQTDVQTIYRGQRLPDLDKVVEIGRVSSFTCTLLPAVDQQPRILVQRHDRVTEHITPAYERVIETRPSEDTTDRSLFVRQVDGVIHGKPITRTKRVELGPWADLPLHIEGRPFRTDAQGIIHDRDEMIARLFDVHDLGRNKLTLDIRHEEFDAVPLAIDREQLLDALGVVFTDPSQSERSGVNASVRHPERMAPGEAFTITLTVQNSGALPLSPLSARTVARAPWLNGRNFYIGTVPSGESRSFSRRFTVPADCGAGPVFAVVGLWDMRHGALPEHAVDITFTVLNASDP